MLQKLVQENKEQQKALKVGTVVRVESILKGRTEEVVLPIMRGG